MATVERLFVLILENRAFDHMLGFSRIVGADAETGASTKVEGLTPGTFSLLHTARSYGTNSLGGVITETGRAWPPAPAVSLREVVTSNVFQGGVYQAGSPASFAMPIDPGHEFGDVLVQLGGPGSAYVAGAAYPGIRSSGFVASYVASGKGANPAEIMRCYAPPQLPVLEALASEFVVCDRWFSSIPGPTWPNRFFAHAASSGGLDHSPSTLDILKYETLDGFSFANGTIFDRLSAAHLGWRIYAGDDFPAVAGLKGVQLTDVHDYDEFAGDLLKADYEPRYTFIEPSYEALSDYKCSTSQHPLDDVTRGEALLRHLYETIRNSPVWDTSMTVITWDEHGGFFDHVPPPSAIPPGDLPSDDDNNEAGFPFDQYGVRVPAVVISPLIPRGLIDHRTYDHSSIPATVGDIFGFGRLTNRDGTANSLAALVSLEDARPDAPVGLPAPAPSGVGGCDPLNFGKWLGPESLEVGMRGLARGEDSADSGNIPGMLLTAMRFDVQMAGAMSRERIRAEVRSIRTRADAMAYMDGVRKRLKRWRTTDGRRR